jgi:ubiquinone/menaquinone biosynthesis C-methylase UbiE
MGTSEKAGHTFLASLGKTRLRPGGVEATEWLFSRARMTPQHKVLEVACNMATTAIEIAQRYGSEIYAIDMDKTALSHARDNVIREGLERQIHVMEANANKLPFPDNSFDVVINEAMLTMYADKAKAKLVSEYFRVLKPGGCLLTHDIMFTRNALNNREHDALEGVVKSNVSPMSHAAWEQLFTSAGFGQVTTHHGQMSLMSPLGLIRDEGFPRAVKIAFNGLRSVNRQRFLGMFRFFRAHRKNLNYIACCSTKS